MALEVCTQVGNVGSNALVGIALTIVSGAADARGFVYAAAIWRADYPSRPDMVRAAGWFALGIALYIAALKFLRPAGLVAPEIQTTTWFAVTIAGVALISGQFLRWQLVDQLVGIGVLMGMAWLLFHTAA